MMCGGVKDVGRSVLECYNVQIREDCEKVIAGYAMNSYYIEVELVKTEPLDKELLLGMNYVVDLNAGLLTTFKGRALRTYNLETLALESKELIEGYSEDTYVF